MYPEEDARKLAVYADFGTKRSLCHHKAKGRNALPRALGMVIFKFAEAAEKS
jgi:hypothetical protein